MSSDMPTNTSLQCTAVHSKLVAACDPKSSKSSSSSDLGGIGIDPVFSLRSAFFNSELSQSPEGFYSASAGELNPFGVPYGFFHAPLAGFDDGYPVLVDVQLPTKRVKQTLTQLKDGAYLSSTLTKQLTAQLLSYNADLSVFGYWRATFRWTEEGTISCRSEEQALPAVSYAQALRLGQAHKVAPDIVLILLVILYCYLTVRDVTGSLRAQRALALTAEQRDAAKVAKKVAKLRTYAAGDLDERPEARDYTPRKYEVKMTPFWIAYESAICAVMLGAIIALYVYGVALTDAAPFAMRRDVYDADLYAAARPLLLKQRSGTVTAPDGRVLAPKAGQAFRHLLPDDPAALRETASMYAAAEGMYAANSAYNALQGIALALLIVRLLNYVSFQPRLSVISGTLARMIPDMAHFFVVFLIVAVMFAGLVGAVFGFRIVSIAGYDVGLATMLQYVVIGDDRGMSGDIMDQSVGATPMLRFVAGLVFAIAPLFFLFTISNFLLAIMGWPYTELKMATTGARALRLARSPAHFAVLAPHAAASLALLRDRAVGAYPRDAPQQRRDSPLILSSLPLLAAAQASPACPPMWPACSASGGPSDSMARPPTGASRA